MIQPGAKDPCDVQKTVKAYLEIEAGEILPDNRGDIKSLGRFSGLEFSYCQRPPNITRLI